MEDKVKLHGLAIIALSALAGCSVLAPNMVNSSTCDQLYGKPLYRTSEADIAMPNALSTLGKMNIRNYADRQDLAILDFNVLGGVPTKIQFRFDGNRKIWEFSNFGANDVNYHTSSYYNGVTNTAYANTVSIGSSTLVVPIDLIIAAAHSDGYFARVHTSASYNEGTNSGSYSFGSIARDYLAMIQVNPCSG